MESTKLEKLGLKRIKDFPNYLISKYGYVFNIKGNKIKPINNGNGYMKVTLYNQKTKQVYVHRLVAQHFIHPVGDEVNHIGGIKDNNKASNLEWCTSSENTEHARANGLMERGVLYDKVDYVLEQSSNGRTSLDIAKELGVKATLIRDITNNRLYKNNPLRRNDESSTDADTTRLPTDDSSEHNEH